MPLTLNRQSARIKWVAQLLYPSGRWRMRIAQELGIGRSTLYRILSSRKETRCGVDDELRVLLARERIASQNRACQIAKVEEVFDSHLSNYTKRRKK
ncbi:MAG: helix-turn-helix domain-containing protein [Afipia felis]|nr:helix-turn-helix domain-containing protein [Afipia felis]